MKVATGLTLRPCTKVMKVYTPLCIRIQFIHFSLQILSILGELRSRQSRAILERGSFGRSRSGKAAQKEERIFKKSSTQSRCQSESQLRSVIHNQCIKKIQDTQTASICTGANYNLSYMCFNRNLHFITISRATIRSKPKETRMKMTVMIMTMMIMIAMAMMTPIPKMITKELEQKVNCPLSEKMRRRTMIPVMTTQIHHRPRKRNTNNSLFEIRFVALSGVFTITHVVIVFNFPGDPVWLLCAHV